jgi:Alpha-kinase family
VLDHTSIAVNLYQPHVTFEELIEGSASKQLLDPASSIYRQFRSTLTFRSSPIMRYGSFKLAFHAHSSEIVLGNSTAVYLKQTYYKARGAQTSQAKPHDPANQIKHLITEIVCLVWADTLLKLVYHFMEGQDHCQQGQERGQNIPVVPQLHFTSCALACSDDRTNIYLVEEFIDEKVEGRFQKYINNSSALVSLSHLRGEEAINIAKFLSFSQHVQYVKTKGLAYISDYQGVI